MPALTAVSSVAHQVPFYFWFWVFFGLAVLFVFGLAFSILRVSPKLRLSFVIAFGVGGLIFWSGVVTEAITSSTVTNPVAQSLSFAFWPIVALFVIMILTAVLEQFLSNHGQRIVTTN
jgi:hypothetical protein